MSDPWFYERTSDGWEIRDESRLLVAYVPDAQHEREADARRIAALPDRDSAPAATVPPPPAS